MVKRFTDPEKWKSQRWYRRLSPVHKICWEYINGICNKCGIWQVCWPDLLDDIGIDTPCTLYDFVERCNRDFDNVTGEQIEVERVILFQNNSLLLITNFLHFQHESKEGKVNPKGGYAQVALIELAKYGFLCEGLRKGWLSLSIPLPDPYGPSGDPPPKSPPGPRRVHDNDIDNDKTLLRILNIGDYGDSKGVQGGKKGDPPPEPFPPANPPKGSMKEVTAEMKKVLCEQMMHHVLHHFPKYAWEPENDHPACVQIALKIAKAKDWPDYSVFNGKLLETMEEWNLILDFAVTDDWFSGRSMKDIGREWQRLNQKRNKKSDGKESGRVTKKSRTAAVATGGFGGLRGN